MGEEAEREGVECSISCNTEDGIGSTTGGSGSNNVRACNMEEEGNESTTEEYRIRNGVDGELT